ncbi:carboxypeptidase regulatory-like domain-containing protein [Candidatus Dependentiae bacterium]|nr:carboxypeptidase regulatory-like domain-containing protein [Candidatus Dependentiae bacterium]
MKKLILITLLILLLFPVVNCETSDNEINVIESEKGTKATCKISGHIKNEFDIPVKNVYIEIKGDTDSSAITDSNGYYEFSSLNTGATYIITPIVLIPLCPGCEYYIYLPENRIIKNISENRKQDFVAIKKMTYSSNLENIKVYPNPYVKNKYKNYITFEPLTQKSKIEIFTLDSKKILEVYFNNSQFKWNVENAIPRISSGIYIYVITNVYGHKKIGKIAIIK